jgi:hypothetical protein
MALGTDQCESIFSYLSRLATAHHVSMARLVANLDELTERKRSVAFAYRSQGKTCPDQDTLPFALVAATGRPEAARCTLGSLSGTIHFRGSFAFDKPRHCPACVTDAPFPKAWNRLLWEIRSVEACPKHNLLLVDSICGREPSDWVYLGERALRPGVCRHCGSLAYMCCSTQPRLASRSQQWVALEVGKIVAASSGGEQFCRETLFKGLFSALESNWPSWAAAERDMGLRAGRLSNVLTSEHPLDLKLLIGLCSHISVEPISVLRGNPRVVTVAVAPVRIEQRTRRRAKGNAEIEGAISQIIELNPDISIADLASSLGVNGDRLRQTFPKLVLEMREQHRFQIRRRRWRRLVAIGRKLRVLRTQLEAEKLTFNPYNVFNRSRIMIRKGEPQERLFLWVKGRPAGQRLMK